MVAWSKAMAKKQRVQVRILVGSGRIFQLCCDPLGLAQGKHGLQRMGFLILDQFVGGSDLLTSHTALGAASAS